MHLRFGSKISRAGCLDRDLGLKDGGDSTPRAKDCDLKPLEEINPSGVERNSEPFFILRCFFSPGFLKVHSKR